MHPPTGPYGQEMVDEVHHVLRSHVEGPCELGPSIEDEDQSMGAGRLDGNPRPIAFDGPWWAWFRRLTPELRRNLLWLAVEMNDKDRREALIELMEREIRRKAVGKFLRYVKRAAISFFLVGALFFAWITDQVTHFVEKWPSIKAAWGILTGGGK